MGTERDATPAVRLVRDRYAMLGLREVWLPLQRDWERITVEPGELIELPAGVLALVQHRGVRHATGASLARNLTCGALAMLHDSRRARRIAV